MPLIHVVIDKLEVQRPFAKATRPWKSDLILTVGEEWQVVDTRTVADWQTDTVQEAEYVSVGITDERDNTVTDEQSEHDFMPMTKSEEHKDRHSNTL